MRLSKGLRSGGAAEGRAPALGRSPLQPAAFRARQQQRAASGARVPAPGAEAAAAQAPSLVIARRGVLLLGPGGAAVVAAMAAAAGVEAATLLAPPAAAAAAAAAEGAAASEAASPCELQQAASGLAWCDLSKGGGAEAIRGALYKVHYTVALGSTGAEFDSSYLKKQPLVVKLGEREVMEAWDRAILGAEGVLPPMREGGKRRIVVPPGPLQQQGTKSLVWMVGLLEALEDAGELSGQGMPTSELVFELELLNRRTR
ncbi:hypothetical protein Rsub_13352 [Raphidocelis subcapitata]|uniref:peptidylprolyl isomerase n=1 Tax=Raphidocelis subcapitata TaxID=307507 RepID=A0A2V0PM22_9CHLO|nr:hypothetical protein Rsub_13352 [Raphidocelis subcapitata]|eukprot:GBG00620.1 hypothetical protein Rsub_13352 [Raphidocelis subcapitata]